MKTSDTIYPLDTKRAEAALPGYLRRFNANADYTLCGYAKAITHFLSFVRKNCRSSQGQFFMTESDVLKWMTQVANNWAVHGTTSRFRRVNQFLEVLASEGILFNNPLAAIVKRYRKHRWRGISAALHSNTPKKSLESLRVPSPFQGNIGQLSEAYLTLKRSRGTTCQYLERALNDLNRFLQRESITSATAVTSSTIYAWTQSSSLSQNTRRARALAVRRFFNYLTALGIVKSNPVVPEILDSIGPHRRVFKPHIYTPEEVAALLREAKRLPRTELFKLKPETFHTMIGLLYTLGLRTGEVLRLRIEDIDLERETLLIRNGKFYKDRLLPFGPKMRKCLEGFLHLRKKAFSPVQSSDRLFVSCSRASVSQVIVNRVFNRLLDSANICGRPGQERPRLYDLRHAFAVNRLLQWYKEGVDVQSRLVHLSTFMGHVGIESTQVYLTMTDELAREANKRFYAACGRQFENSCEGKEIS